MRLFTYLSLVVRRMWAKRGLLVGSFLGAILVVALLAIVPLYESSIAAVDLLFTFRQAPSVAVDLLATRPTGDYSAESAAEGRETLQQALATVEPWYVEADERSLSREVVVIPPTTPDWLAAAATWRSAALEWREQAAAVVGGQAEDLGPPAVAAVSLAGRDDVPDFPAPPYPRPSQEALQVRILTAPRLKEAVELIAGEWPVPPDPGDDDPALRVVIGEDVARLGALAVGDTTIIRPFVALPESFEVVEVAGVFRPVDRSDPLWTATTPGRLAVLPQDVFDFWTSPVPVDYTADPWLRPVRGFGQMSATQSWYLPLQRDTVRLDNVADLEASVRGFAGTLGQTAGIAVSTALPQLVESFDVRTTVFGGPILAMLVLVVAGALYFLIYTASLTLEREGPELALLRTRGAGTWQTVGIHLLQSGLLAIGAGIVGPVVARGLVSLTGRVPPMSDLTGGEALAVTQVRPLLPWVAIGVAVTFAAMGLAILPFARRTVLELRSVAARPTRTSVWQRYYIDVFLVVLAGILLFELRQRGLVSTGEEVGLDPFAVASPALFLFAGALLLLRVLPWVLRGLGWLMARLPGLSAALPGWHLGRNPVPYGRLALLVWITTGFGAFALTYAQTLDRSYDDRAAFAAGSDVRIVAEGAAYLPAPDGARAVPVMRTRGAARLTSRVSELLAVPPSDFADLVAWRADFGASDPAEVFGALRPEGGDYDWGVELPADTAALVVDALPIPATSADAADEPLRFMARVADGRGRLWSFASGPLDATAWTTAEISLDPAAARNPGPAELPPPLYLQALWAERPTQGIRPILRGERLLWRELRASGPSGTLALDQAVAAELTDRNGLRTTAVDADLAARTALPGADDARLRTSPLYGEGPAFLWDLPSRDQLGQVPHVARESAPLRVLLDGPAAGVAAISPGEETLFGIEGAQIPGTRAGPQLGVVPTATDRTTTGTIVVDLDALLHWLNGAPRWALRAGQPRLPEPQELWVATDDPDGAVRALIAGLEDEPDLVITARSAAVDFSSRPVQVGLVAILFVGAFTGVVLALAGVTGYVLVAVRRRAREMGVLRALGFPRRGVAATFAVEQLVVLLLGAAIGVAAGVGLMRLLVPFLQLGESAEDLVPSVILVLRPATLAAYLGVVALLVVGSVLWSTRNVSARRLSEVLREVDR